MDECIICCENFNLTTRKKIKCNFCDVEICLKCNKKRKTTRTMHAHHHYSWHQFPEKRYDKHNGVVMCIKCHNEFHHKYKYNAITNPKLLSEYLKSG